MSPNPNAKNQTLTDAHVQMCVDYLSELDFIPVKERNRARSSE